MLILVAALLAAQTPDYTYHIAARPGTPIARLQTLCKQFDAAKTERERRRYLPEIKQRLANYQGDRDELLMRCQNRIEVR